MNIELIDESRELLNLYLNECICFILNASQGIEFSYRDLESISLVANISKHLFLDTCLHAQMHVHMHLCEHACVCTRAHTHTHCEHP